MAIRIADDFDAIRLRMTELSNSKNFTVTVMHPVNCVCSGECALISAKNRNEPNCKLSGNCKEGYPLDTIVKLLYND